MAPQIICISLCTVVPQLFAVEDVVQRFKDIEKKSFMPLGEYILGKIYFQISSGDGPVPISTLIKNAVFLAKTLPFARKRAEYHFNNAIDIANEIGTKGIMGQAYFDLGLLYKAKKREDQAKQCLLKAVQLFEETDAEVLLKQARAVLESSA